MTYSFIKCNGQYLGFCNDKGYVYSVPAPSFHQGKQLYKIVSVCNGRVTQLIEFYGNRVKEEVEALV